MTGGLPNGGVHENGRVQPHNIFLQLNHGPPPIGLEIVFQHDAVLPIVIHGTQAVIDLTVLEDKTILLRVGYYCFECVFRLSHVR